MLSFLAKLSLLILVWCSANATLNAETLRWTDVVTFTRLDGGTSGYQLVVHLDVQRMAEVVAMDDDPYWFQYLKRFWSDGKHVSIKYRYDVESRTRGACRNPERTPVYGISPYGGLAAPGHSDFKKSNLFVLPECFFYRDRSGAERSYIAYRWAGRLDNPSEPYFPSVSSLGPNYGNMNGGGITLNFKIFRNIYVDAEGKPKSDDKGVGHWVDIRAGEVTADGWGIVPLTADAQENGGFYQWLFVVPDHESIKVTKCPPRLYGCRGEYAPSIVGGPNYIHDPPLWRTSRDRDLDQVLKRGISLGAGDSVSDNDINAEGFYKLEREGDTWKHTRLTLAEGLALAVETQMVTMNGSGNNFESGIANGIRMATEAGADVVVHYYMPQKGNAMSYNSATNVNARSALRSLYKKAQDANTTINLQTHSWSGYLAVTECNGHCSNINLISYTPATLPGSRREELSRGYRTWNGTGHIEYSSKDLVSSGTYDDTRGDIASNRNLTVDDAKSEHGLARVLETADFSHYFK